MTSLFPVSCWPEHPRPTYYRTEKECSAVIWEPRKGERLVMDLKKGRREEKGTPVSSGGARKTLNPKPRLLTCLGLHSWGWRLDLVLLLFFQTWQATLLCFFIPVVLKKKKKSQMEVSFIMVSVVAPAHQMSFFIFISSTYTFVEYWSSSNAWNDLQSWGTHNRGIIILAHGWCQFTEFVIMIFFPV